MPHRRAKFSFMASRSSKSKSARARVLALALAVCCSILAEGRNSFAFGSDEPDPKAAAAILTANCISCHGPDQKKGDLDLTRRAAALKGGKSGVVLVPGSPDESVLIDKIEGGEMPPKKALAADQIATVRAWVQSGAKYPSEPLAVPRAGPDWWSLQPIRPVVVPQVSRAESAWTRNPIDAFIIARLHKSGLAQAPEALRRSLIRRVTFDLTGLPPSPEAVDQFVADPDPRV